MDKLKLHSILDRVLHCQDCSEPFVWTEKEQGFYKEKGYGEPKRCKKCRAKRKGQQPYVNERRFGKTQY